MPDIQWHIDEDANQETIVKSTEPQRSRYWLVILLTLVILGVGLRMAYRAAPEPAPWPTPVPQPTPTRQPIPAKLFNTIDREAQALAAGDLATYLEVRRYPTVPAKASGGNLTAWGRPQDDRPLYTVVDFAIWKEGRAWADVRQFREGRYFRETRFYYAEGERWLRSVEPDRFLWNELDENVQTPHFNVIYAHFDRDILSPTLHQLEEDYVALCRDLGCAMLEHELTFTLKLAAMEVPVLYPAETGTVEIRLLSPRITGFFESGRAYGWKNTYLHEILAQVLVEQIYGANSDQPGSMILLSSITWASNRRDPLPKEFRGELDNLTQTLALPLEKLWEPGMGESARAYAQATYLLRFVEQTYGALSIARLLKTLGAAKSLPEAIETGLGVPYAEFDQKWQAWVKQNIPSQ